MKCDGRDNTKKPCSFIFVVVPSKIKNTNKTRLSNYSDLEESLFWNDSKSIRNINDNENGHNDNSK